MLLTISAIIAFAISIAIIIAGYINISDTCEWFGGIFTAISGVVLIVCIFNIIGANANNSALQSYVPDRIDELNAEYKTLEQMNEFCNNKVITPTEMTKMVKEYNSEITNFRKEIAKGKYWANNLWTNWLNTKIYNSFTGEEVQYYSFVNPEP